MFRALYVYLCYQHNNLKFLASLWFLISWNHTKFQFIQTTFCPHRKIFSEQWQMAKIWNWVAVTVLLNWIHVFFYLSTFSFLHFFTFFITYIIPFFLELTKKSSHPRPGIMINTIVKRVRAVMYVTEDWPKKNLPTPGNLLRAIDNCSGAW